MSSLGKRKRDGSSQEEENKSSKKQFLGKMWIAQLTACDPEDPNTNVYTYGPCATEQEALEKLLQGGLKLAGDELGELDEEESDEEDKRLPDVYENAANEEVPLTARIKRILDTLENFNDNIVFTASVIPLLGDDKWTKSSAYHDVADASKLEPWKSYQRPAASVSSAAAVAAEKEEEAVVASDEEDE